MQINRLLLIIVSLTVLLTSLVAKTDVNAVVLKQDFLYTESSLQSERKYETRIGETFKFIAEEPDWVNVEYRGLSLWLQKKLVALSDNPNYQGKVVIKVNIELQTAGETPKTVKYLKKGEILTIIDSDLTGYELKTVDGKTGWLKGRYFTRIGDMAEFEKSKEKFAHKMMRKEGKVYDLLQKIKDWGDQSKTKKNMVKIFSIILYFLPMFIVSKFVNFVCSIKIIPTWVIRVSLIFIGIYALGYVFPIYFMTPLYNSVFYGYIFMFLLVLWIGREFTKIEFHRCPACHSMFATSNKGKVSFGISTTIFTREYRDGSKSVTSKSSESTRDDRQCLRCGHRWSIHRTRIF